VQDKAKPSTGLSVEELEETIWLLVREARQHVEHAIYDTPAAMQRDAIDAMREGLDRLEKELDDEKVAS
jgi:hypothetical protein